LPLGMNEGATKRKRGGDKLPKLSESRRVPEGLVVPPSDRRAERNKGASLVKGERLQAQSSGTASSGPRGRKSTMNKKANAKQRQQVIKQRKRKKCSARARRRRPSMAKAAKDTGSIKSRRKDATVPMGAK